MEATKKPMYKKQKQAFRFPFDKTNYALYFWQHKLEV
jgi:hypothetical protein